MDMKIKVNSFFSGIGGFDLAFEKMGFEITYQCEINQFCNNILNDKWPLVPKGTDIRLLSAEDIPDADIWCGGFPCQDLSVARGSMGREGLKGKNSGLFYNFLELIKIKKPKVILIENVTGLLSSHYGNDFKIIIQSLATCGYGVSWRVFNTRYFGTPQSRPRVYICAWIGSLEKAAFSLHEFEASVKKTNPRSGFLQGSKDKKIGVNVPEVAYCLAATSGRHTGTDWSRTYVSYSNKVRRLTPSESEKLQGFPSGWSIPNNISKEDILDIDTLRYHAIGNAVSVPVVVWIADRIKKIFDKNIINRGMQPTLRKFSDFTANKIRTQFYSQLNAETLFTIKSQEKIKWQTGGMSIGDEIVDCKVENCPTMPYESKLIDLIDTGFVDPKYFISASAATGIIRRVNSQGRKLFTPLMNALMSLSKSAQSLTEINKIS